MTPVNATVYLSRRYRFSATHRLYAPALSDAENRRIFGKCANDNGHGHNYQFYVTVAGQVHPETGVVCDIDALDALVHDRIISRYHHRHLNLDVEDYVDLVPTGENIVRRMWDLLEGSVPGARPSTSGRARLHRLRLIETRDNSFEYSGGQG